MSAGSRTLQRFRLNPVAHGRLGHTAIEGAHWEMTCRAPHSLLSTFGRCGEPIDGLTGFTFAQVSGIARDDIANGIERLCARHLIEQAERAARERGEQVRETAAAGAET